MCRNENDSNHTHALLHCKHYNVYTGSNLTFVGLTQTIFNHAILVDILLVVHFKLAHFVDACFSLCLSSDEHAWCVNSNFPSGKFIFQIVFHQFVGVHSSYCTQKIRTLFQYKHMRINGTQYTLPVERFPSQLLPVRALLPFFRSYKRDVHTIQFTACSHNAAMKQ